MPVRSAIPFLPSGVHAALSPLSQGGHPLELKYHIIAGSMSTPGEETTMADSLHFSDGAAGDMWVKLESLALLSPIVNACSAAVGAALH